jgi:hypothetical protein
MEQGTHANIMHVKVIMHGDLTHAVWHIDFGSFVTGLCTGHCHMIGHL